MVAAMQRRHWVWLAVACLLAVGLTGCGDSGKTTLTFMYWSTYGASTPALNDAFARFRKTHPTLDVAGSQAPQGGVYYQKLLITFGAQASPDVFFIDAPTLGGYASHGGLVDLTARVRAAHLAQTPARLAACRYGGKVYGVPAGRVCYAISAQTHSIDAAWDLLTDLVRAGYPAR
ncbi:MAG: hypothetical protein NVSMB65_01180 [Chloroflexota bacterium]